MFIYVTENPNKNGISGNLHILCKKTNVNVIIGFRWQFYCNCMTIFWEFWKLDGHFKVSLEIMGENWTDGQICRCNQLDTDMDVTEHGTYPQRHSGKMTINVAKHDDLKSV